MCSLLETGTNGAVGVMGDSRMQKNAINFTKVNLMQMKAFNTNVDQ